MRIEFRREQIPWMMAGGRAALGPVLIAGQACGWNGVALAGIIVSALVSDIFDGVLARRWGCDTAGVRLFDSMADTVFYVCTAVALWMAQSQIWTTYGWLLGLLLATEAMRFGFDFVKFGKPASYHTYMAKCWGLVMAIAVIGVFAIGRANVLVPVALGMGIVCNVEGLVMSVLLPEWRKDVKGIWELRALRKEMVEKNGILRVNKAAQGFVVIGLLMMTVPMFAVEAGQVAYVGGTVTTVPLGSLGKLDTSSSEALVFTADAGKSTSGGNIGIDYKKISKFEYSKEVTHHLGVLPAVAVSLVKRRERKHFFTITYKDSTDAVQVAIFEVSKGDPPGLLAVLRARAPQVCKPYQTRCGE